jgi:uncharacterized protein
MTTDIERWTTEAAVECRGGKRTIGGLALRFGSRSLDLGGFTEVVAPQFCDQTRARNFSGVICRYNHDSRLVLGNVDNGTLRCAVDDSGLDYSVDLPEWPGPPYIWEMVQRGDVRHSSFSMCVDRDGGDQWTYQNGAPLRTLVSGVITEVAPCPQAAYPDATCALRSLARTMSASYEEVVELAEQRSLSRFFTRSDRPAAPPAKTSRSELVETLAEQFPEVRHVGKSGKQALDETMAARARSGRERLAETMGERFPELRTTPWDARLAVTLAATPPVYCPTEVSIAEYKALAELDAVRAAAESRRALAEAESRSAEVARPPEPPRRTLTGAEALRILDSMRPSLPYESAESAGLRDYW